MSDNIIGRRLNVYINSLQVKKEKLELDLESLVNSTTIDNNMFYMSMDNLLRQIQETEDSLNRLMLYLSSAESTNNDEKND